MRRRDAVE
jgi:hypothetical protein